MMRINARLIAFVAVLMCSVVVHGQEDNSAPLKLHYYVAINLATPLGSHLSTSYKYPLSYVASNQAVSFYGEIRYSWLGLRIPVRIPLSHLGVNDVQSSDIWGGGYNYIWDTQFEAGIKPVLYMSPADDLIQVYGGMAYYYGKRRGVLMTTYDYYSLSPITELYTVDAGYENEYSMQDWKDYGRTTLFAGTQVQFKNGFGLGADLEVFYARINNFAYVRYTNYNTTDGHLYKENEQPGGRKDMGVQFGFYLTYRIK